MCCKGSHVGVFLFVALCLVESEVNGSVSYYSMNPNCDRTAIVRQLLRVCTLRSKRNALPYYIQPNPFPQDPGGADYELPVVPPGLPQFPHPVPVPVGPLDFQGYQRVGYPFLAPLYPPYFLYEEYPRPVVYKAFYADKRWRRHTRFNEIVKRCCMSQCLTSDLLNLDRDFNICDK